MTILERAIETYGKDMQLNVAIEELSELIKEICKHKRGADNREAIIEEMADCYIMMEQLQIIFETSYFDIDVMLAKKLDRLEKRLDGNDINVPTTSEDKGEVRHGEWKDDNRLSHSAKFRCSVCDGLAYYPQPTRDKMWKRCCPYKYCPNCGAKMKGAENEQR